MRGFPLTEISLYKIQKKKIVAALIIQEEVMGIRHKESTEPEIRLERTSDVSG